MNELKEWVKECWDVLLVMVIGGVFGGFLFAPIWFNMGFDMGIQRPTDKVNVECKND